MLRQQIEDVLAHRVASPLTTRERAEPERIACGFSTLDELLQGGLPAGVLTEFVGSECSGRTTAAMAYVAAVARKGNVCAWIDVADALNPESVAANGMDLQRLLWVRCGAAPAATAEQAAVVTSDEAGCAVMAPPGPRVRGGGSPHPRAEGRDMPQAISELLQAHGGLYDRQIRREKKKLGTPGAPNRPLTHRSIDREEQVASDRVAPRRGQQIFAPCCSEPQPKQPVNAAPMPRLLAVPKPASAPIARSSAKPWSALDQALRAADLLLQSGGFSLIVLDLGSTSAEFALRIPLATWFRFRAACERTQVSMLLLTQQSCARSSAELVVRMNPGTMEAASKVMTGIRYRAETERGRSQPARVVSIRKPPQSERGVWQSSAAWAQRR